MHRTSRTVATNDSVTTSYQFPKPAETIGKNREEANGGDEFMADSAENVLAALANVSRRIDDLARELNCLGYFDDDSDRPKAA